MQVCRIHSRKCLDNVRDRSERLREEDGPQEFYPPGVKGPLQSTEEWVRRWRVCLR
jgi:hypothetical protein